LVAPPGRRSYVGAFVHGSSWEITPMMSVPDAEDLAAAVHGEDRTRSGGLVIEHVRRVAVQMQGDPDPYAVPAALLHDIVEKGSARWSDLRAVGADDRLLALIDALTERDGESVEAYLARCVADPLTLRIKRADIGDKLTAVAQQGLTIERVEQVRARAHERLDLLERLATGHGGRGPEAAFVALDDAGGEYHH
jgi:(p)ppGpp synthase/HD superfamily hydrolase